MADQEPAKKGPVKQEPAKQEPAKKPLGERATAIGNALPGNELSGKRMFIAAFIGSVAIITWQEISRFNRLPLPSRFIDAGLAFGLLAIAEPIISPELAGVLAWGLLMGLAYQQTSKADIIATPPNGIVPIPLTLQPKQKP